MLYCICVSYYLVQMYTSVSHKMKSRKMFWVYFTGCLLLPKSILTFLIPPISPIENESYQSPSILKTQELKYAEVRTPLRAAMEQPRKSDLSRKEITNLYKKREIIPDLFPDKAPKNIVKCKFENDRVVNFGTNLTLLQTIKKPEHCEWPAEEGAFYVLMLLGLDSPTYKHCYEREYNHWLVGNIPQSNLERGEIIAEYQGGQIDYEPGDHRLVFVVYKQPGKIIFNETRLEEMSEFWDRVLFTHEDFSRKYKLGNPHASNFFYMSFQNEQTF